jgi:tRNA-uridine 2-sulfurtransferase
MLAEALTYHLEAPTGRGHEPTGAVTGAAGGAACGDLIRVSLAVDAEHPEGLIVDAGFDASGCGTVIAAGSATVSLIRGVPLLQAARIDAAQIAEELGGLIPAKQHAAELAADALHRALGGAARTQARLRARAGRTLVAMSGGVDSAVAALLVAEGSSEVVAVTLELWSDPENDGERSCCSAQAVRGAREVAHGLGMPHLSIDLREEFRAGVVDGWLEDYASGLTPNPCVRCNGNVRLDAMLDLGERLGSETLATGHYARVADGGAVVEPGAGDGKHGAGGGHDAGNGESDAVGSGHGAGAGDGAGEGPLLRLAADVGKDQSYVLAALAPASLARMRFPLGELHKPAVRELAESARLAVARKPDSQDLCFLAGTGLSRFLERHGEVRTGPGSIVDQEGRELGRHEGNLSFTVGQRRGLAIGGGPPLYVLGTDPQANTVTVGPREALMTTTVEVRDATLRRGGGSVDAVKLRSHGRMIPCRVSEDLGSGSHPQLRVELLESVVRAAPGQMACLFSGDLIVGYGTIT